MTADEMQKVIEAFAEITDVVESGAGIVALIKAFPEYREQILSESDRLESDDGWLRGNLERLLKE